jgi:cell division cycle 2-like protein
MKEKSNTAENEEIFQSENKQKNDNLLITVEPSVSSDKFLKKRQRINLLEGSRSIENYEYLNKIDEGAYGVVFRAKDKETGEVVAIKKVKLHKEKEGFPITSIREINILLLFNHENIVKVKEVVIGNSLEKVFVVMEYLDYELKALITDKKYIFNLSHLKCMLLQLLKGVEYMHSNWVFHRDLKTSNLLLSNKGILKIGDFGLARKYGSPIRPYTQLVVTLWYRAPELLLGCEKYNYAIDMWSVGCIFAELFLRDALLQGQDELDQLNKIFRLLGTPTEETWNNWTQLPNAKKINFKKYTQCKLREKFPKASFTDDIYLTDLGIDLMKKLLAYNPSKRITASEALRHPWFNESPKPCIPSEMPIFPEINDKEREFLKKNRKKSLDEVQMKQRENLYENEERYKNCAEADYVNK